MTIRLRAEAEASFRSARALLRCDLQDVLHKLPCRQSRLSVSLAEHQGYRQNQK